MHEKGTCGRKGERLPRANFCALDGLGVRPRFVVEKGGSKIGQKSLSFGIEKTGKMKKKIDCLLRCVKDEGPKKVSKTGGS
jgi:hypothetical protein